MKTDKLLISNEIRNVYGGIHRPLFLQPMKPNAHSVWVLDYADLGLCIELSAVYDDILKKDNSFTGYAVDLAQRIADQAFGEDALTVTWGKWGARLEMDKNVEWSWRQLEIAARTITDHRAWQALKLSTWIFTFERPPETPKIPNIDGETR